MAGRYQKGFEMSDTWPDQKTWKSGNPLITKTAFLNAYDDWRTTKAEDAMHDARILNRWRIEGEEVVAFDAGLNASGLHEYGVMLRSTAEYLISTGGKIVIL